MNTAQLARSEANPSLDGYDAMLLESYGLAPAEIATMTHGERAEVVRAFEDAIAGVKQAVQARLDRRGRTAPAKRKQPHRQE